MSNASDKTLEFQCPKCARRLKASSKAAGKRLKCPGCGQPVKVPGPAASPGAGAAADDDWLGLDNLESTAAAPRPTASSPVAAAGAQPGAAASSPSGKASSSKASSAGTASGTAAAGKTPSAASPAGKTGEQRPISTSVFDDDLPELAELEPPRPRVDLGGVFGLEDLEGLVPPVVPPTPPSEGAGTSDGGKSDAARRAELKDLANQQYRVPCPACGTPQYVTVAQKGKTVKCPDCFLDFKIPPPPPGWKPSSKPSSQPASKNWGTDLVVQTKEEAERDSARSRSAADEYLRTAEQELNDAEIDSLYQGDFDTQSFMHRTFGFCYDMAALAQAVAHSFVFAIGFAAIAFCVHKVYEGDMGYALIGGLGIPLIFIMAAFPMFAAAMTLLESVANGEPRVREWPGFSFFDHIGELMLFAVALAAAAAPGFLLGGFIGRTGGMAWMVVFCTLLTIFLFLPIILLSMLDNESLFGFVSPDVLKSLSKAYEAWGIYYFKTFVAFSIVFISWAVVLNSGQPLLFAVGGALVPWLIFFTSQQLGVLAGDISEHLSIVLEPSAKKEENEEE
ncbi:MAG: hypothetical protein ACTHK7_14630 [Aureliella sp.]